MEVIKKIELKERVCAKGTLYSHKRSKKNIYPRYSLITIENVKTREAAMKYVGNAVELFKPESTKEESIHGIIKAVHGRSGAVRAKFSRNISPVEMGSKVYIKLYKMNEDEI
ncbi:60S ribosomal protein L35a [Spraguea lophii 42_110]|uniref:60S ribosomal protein L35a n=1 Tax=Spraguea lophii (strain 42_110) TaxID=1358809 RepID=S7W662_SPRLO|nr:Chain LFF, 60S ribosomal protein L35a [Spraguea lophii 42_110]7QJH_KFF Chain KFF, 60S ribosomal protein L35a [Spraguea lophii 42_110]7QJH_LFF Chain LFF, 60S ribosomal protein L35a [Spraguea lophii 42_110]8BR3_LFF Chain LFF, 60S ribosomal protein L35a [Spraguea lophii 42_110]8P5D_LFF Chain LFF, 60S ribosomal protein L35a [Spraguea lophii 42_110]8P60_KFF Chain KFF, 60S ribosomal protein L35a [Spraguea lophii 42_110]8P60_LFF Chain LFF, 60S ribosomal protein L35a [Spraguea lophii 42_110]EPR78